MNYIFSAIGGSGSTYLINELLKNKYEIQGRPDYLFVPDVYLTDKDTVTSEDSPTQIIVGGDYSIQIKPSTLDCFYAMFGKNVNNYDMTVAEVILEYIEYLKGKRNATTVFCYLAMGGFFSKHKVENVVYLIRHPLHAYVSLAGHQHPHLSKKFGGLNTEKAVRWYADVWNSVASEYLICKEMRLNHHIVRYALSIVDAHQLPFKTEVFTNLKSSKRNNGVLTPRHEKLLWELTKHNYNQIYTSWEI